MGKRIHIKAGRHGNPGAPLVQKKAEKARAALQERKERSYGLKQLARQRTDDANAAYKAYINSPEHKRSVLLSKLTWQYKEDARPRGKVGHLCDPAPGVLDGFTTQGHFELKHQPPVCEDQFGFTTIHIRWITCPDCLTLIDWALANSLFELNDAHELVDPLPEDDSRKKLRKEWRRLKRRVVERKAAMAAGISV